MTMMGKELGYTGNRVVYSKLWKRFLALLIYSLFAIRALTQLEEFSAPQFFLSSNHSSSGVQLKNLDLESGNNHDDKDVEEEEEMVLLQQDEEVTPASDSDIVVMVMGEKAVFRTWLHRLQSIKGQLTFIYASFDKEILLTKDELELDFNYNTLFIPNTTWTEGRTMLGEEALRKEKARRKEFDYWLFADDDVDVTCLENEESRSFFGDEKNCWQRVFDFIARDDIPAKASSIVAKLTACESIAAMSTYDAFFNAFKREYVPYLQPYPKLPKGFSEWMSQGALFCLLKTCMPGSAVVFPYMKFRNSAHRDYSRGYSKTQIQIAIRNNYDDNEMNFHPCPKRFNLRQNQDYIDKFQSLSELNDNMQTSDITQCDAMKKRFQEWQSTVLGKN